MLYIDEFASQRIARVETVERDRALRRNERPAAPGLRPKGLLTRLVSRIAGRRVAMPATALECERSAAAAVR